LFCLLWLISECADRIGYITNFCGMIRLLHELKNSSGKKRSIQAFDNVSAEKKENYCKSLLASIHNKKSNVNFRTLCAFSILV